MDIAEHIAALRAQGEALAVAASKAGLDAPVPPCAPWRVKDLLRHTGFIHRWAASHITGRPAKIIGGPAEAEILSGGAPDGELLDWYRSGHAALVAALAAADPDLETATFFQAPSPLTFWARRQAHETAIHRADADSASGTLPAYPAGFAADGIEELTMGFGRRRKYRPAADGQGALLFLATDTGDQWHAWASDARADEVACTVSGPASGLYLFLWNRGDAAGTGVDVGGDPAVLALWKSAVRVRWG